MALFFVLGGLSARVVPAFISSYLSLNSKHLIDMRVVTAGVEKQEAITKDNVPIKVDAVVWYRVVDPAKSVVKITNVYTAVTQISLTTLRNIIGRHTLDDVLKEKDKLSEEMRQTIDLVTEPWGIEVQMVEMKDVVIPANDAARDGARSRGAAREAGARDQGGSRGGSSPAFA